MLQRLTSPMLLEFAYQQITALFRAHAEWLYVASDGTAQSLRREELDVAIVHKKLVLSCWTEKGNRLWRILAWNWNGQALELETSRRLGGVRERDSTDSTYLCQTCCRDDSRRAPASLRPLSRNWRRLCSLRRQIERLSLSRGTRPGQPGRYAQILLRRKRARIAVTGPVVTSHPAVVDAFLSSALLWFRRTSDRIKPPHVEQLWLVVSPELLKPMTLPRLASAQ